jgi:Flp pilus assembly protein protease CpaA
MDFIFFNIGIVLVALILATYFDLKSKEIPNFITYPLIIIGFFVMLLNMGALSGTGLFAYSILIFALVFFILGFFLNRKGVFGGGDVKLITGLILMTPIKFMSVEFFLFFFICTCICALLYYGITVLVGKEKLSKSAVIKFAPSILVGYIIVVVAFL